MKTFEFTVDAEFGKHSEFTTMSLVEEIGADGTGRVRIMRSGGGFELWAEDVDGVNYRMKIPVIPLLDKAAAVVLDEIE